MIEKYVFEPGGYSGFQVMGMIEWRQLSKPKNFLGLPTKPTSQQTPPPPTPQKKSHALNFYRKD